MLKRVVTSYFIIVFLPLLALAKSNIYSEDFSLGAQGWQVSPAAVDFNYSSGIGHEFNGCAVLNIPNDEAANFSLKANNLLITVQPKEYYIVRAWVKSQNKCSAMLSVTIKDSKSANLDSYTSQYRISGKWSIIETAVFTADKGALLRLDFTFTGNGKVYIDDITVQRCSRERFWNLDFESVENSWPRSWPAVAWPPNKSRVYSSNKSPFDGNGCMAFELKGENGRAVALNFPNKLAGSAVETPIALSGLKSFGIACRSSGPKISLVANYYTGPSRKAIERFDLPATGKWQQFNCVLTPSAETDYVQLEILAEGQGTAFVDKITINPLADIALVKGNAVERQWLNVSTEKPADLGKINTSSQEIYQPITASKNKSLVNALKANRGIHPRLMFKQEDIEKFKNMAGGTHAHMYDRLIEAVNNQLAGKLNGHNNWTAAILQSFGYVMTQDKTVLAQAKLWLLDICDQYWMPSDLSYTFGTPALALGYDWLYPVLTPQERDELRLKISIFTRPWYEVTVAMGKSGAWQFNHVNLRPIGFGLAGMTLYGDGCAYGGDETAADWANYSKWCIDSTIATLPTDGSYQEGVHYWSCVSEWFVKYFLAYQRLTGENLYDSSNWFKTTEAFRFYLTTTDWQNQACFSDCIIDEIENYPSVTSRALAGQNGPYAQLAQWVADKCNSLNDVSAARNDERRVWEFLVYDPRVKPAGPEELNLQKLHYFDDIGVVASHSSWDANDTFFVFKCGPYGCDSGAKRYEAGLGGRWGHNHPDAASWQLFHRGIPLALDVGYDMCKRTFNHNTIMPGDFTQIGDGETWLSSITPYSQAPRITKFAGDSNLFYIKAQAAGNYDSNAQLKQFDRTVYGIGGKWFVIIDDLASDVNHSYQWILNTRRAGNITGRTVEIIDDGGPVPRGKYHPNKGDIGKINPNGPSRLIVQFFSPEKLTLTGQITDIEKPIDTFTQVWRMKAVTEPVKTAKFISVIVPLGPADETPCINYTDNTIIFDTNSGRTVFELNTGGVPRIKFQTKETFFDRAYILQTMKQVTVFQKQFADDTNGTDWKTGTFYTGVLAAYKATGDKYFYDIVKDWGKAAGWKLANQPFHADYLCAGQTFLDMYLLDKDPNMRADVERKLAGYFGKRTITYEEMPHVTNKDSKRSFRGREAWYWCDSLFMAPPVFTKMYTVTNDKRYLKLMDKFYWDTTEFLLDKKANLFYRDLRYFTAKTPQGNSVFWSRGNGWVYAGLIRILDNMPADWPTRDKYLELFRKMTEGIVKYQQADGLWRSSLNEPSWYDMPETSGSSFFCYGLAAGINRGYLDKSKYLPAATKAWQGLLGCVNSQGRLGHVQLVASKPGSVKEEDFTNYAQGAFLLAASEIYKMHPSFP
ncbi:MAG: glycoside hydrolase family 88 protein [Phycisphaerae bacterium]|jgi:rhamnogalacturonyl hydrolase YesR